jgi:hypothetical protein
MSIVADFYPLETSDTFAFFSKASTRNLLLPSTANPTTVFRAEE